jgi:peptide/nickel transport system permease protein
MTPGDPIYIFIGDFAVTPEYIAMLRAKLGLDKSVYEQLFLYIANVIKGDLGFSFYYRAPVIDVILARVPATLLLMLTSLVVSSIMGVLLGIIAAYRRYSLVDTFISSVSVVGYGTPIFWFGQMLILSLALYLGWFPVGGMTTLGVEMGRWESIIDILIHLILPVFTLAFYWVAFIARLARTSILEALGENFVVMARAKGLRERTVVYKHALKNALIPIITIIGIHFGTIFSGAVLTETVFAWPGLGRLIFESVRRRDYPVLMGSFIFISVMVVVANLLTDIVYAYLDPRIRYK